MSVFSRLNEGNRQYIDNSDPKMRVDTAENGQRPFAIVVCCSDSRVIPEKIFSTDIGELFVIRVAGNVLDYKTVLDIEKLLETENDEEAYELRTEYPLSMTQMGIFVESIFRAGKESNPSLFFQFEDCCACL